MFWELTRTPPLLVEVLFFTEENRLDMLEEFDFLEEDEEELRPEEPEEPPMNMDAIQSYLL